ncbi:MAG: hypothetical protein H0U66_06135, partial [Gemmatimonadaceae bacterium]|nr:hypothetical protein [Gemmatimonadaceae bacterium]
MFAYRPNEKSEHVDLTLLVHGLERDDVPRRVIEQRVNPNRLLLTTRRDDLRAVADVAVPERPRPLRLPSEALLAVGPLPERRAIEATRREEPTNRGRGDGALVDASFGDEGVDDQLRGRARVFAPNVADEILLIDREGARGTAIGARRWTERGEAPRLVQAIPAFESRHRERARRIRARWPEPLLGKQLQASGELAAREIEAREDSDDLASEESDLFRVIDGCEFI